MRNARPRVLHVAIRALERSQTFVQRRLIGDAFESQLLAWDLLDDGLAPGCPVILASPGESSLLSRHWARAAASLRQHQLLLQLRRIRPDIIHAHFGPAGGRVAISCSMLRIPLVTSFYGFDAGARADGFQGRKEFRAMIAAGATFTAEGPVLVRRLIALGASADRVKLLPLCLPDWALRDPVRSVGYWDRDFHLLQVARFVEKKGVDTTLLAVAEARRLGVPVRLTLVGDGELRPRLEALAAELQLGEVVRWTGFLPYQELPRLLASAHAFIQPSRTAGDGDTEGGHPTTLIEAMAQGVPVFSTRHADIPLVVRDGQTGLLTNEGDSAQLAQAILTLHRSRERLHHMSERARSMTLRRHDPVLLRGLRERIYLNAMRSADKS
jgi:colanic acid/amylovoran biosynthesis glycosyltransferase